MSPDLLTDVRFMRVKQISNHMSISRPYVYKLIANGDFPDPVFLNGIRMWEKKSIDQWIAGKISGGQSC